MSIAEDECMCKEYTDFVFIMRAKMFIRSTSTMSDFDVSNPAVFTCGLRVEFLCVCDEERRLKGVLLAIALYFIFLD